MGERSNDKLGIRQWNPYCTIAHEYINVCQLNWGRKFQGSVLMDGWESGALIYVYKGKHSKVYKKSKCDDGFVIGRDGAHVLKYFETQQCYIYFRNTQSIQIFTHIKRWGTRCSIGMERLNWASSTDLRLSSASTCVFSTRGTCRMVKVRNAFNNA